MLGNADSRVALARLYLSGEYGVTPSEEKAYKHCSQGAAISGTPELLAAQGFMLLCGKGTKQDTERGKQLLELAASAQYPYAKVLLGYAYHCGIGVEQSASQARYNLEAAALQQFPLAFVYLALMNDSPASGIEPNPSQCKYYLNHAEREMPGKATDLFKKLKNQECGWAPPPFQLRKL
jgi:TPR repeat protein